MLLYDGEQFERHAAGFLGTRLPLLHRRLSGIQVAGEDWLADAETLPECFDLMRLDWGRGGETGLVKAAHGGCIDCAGTNHSGNGAVNCLERVCFIFTILFHGIFGMRSLSHLVQLCSRWGLSTNVLGCESSLAHFAVMGIRECAERWSSGNCVGVLVVIGVALLALAPAKQIPVNHVAP
jgi:hypothetical protein